MRVLLVIGTRPEAIKCFPVVEALRQRKGFEVTVCISAQHRQILDQMMTLVGLKADYDLKTMRASPTLTQITCDVLQSLQAVMQKAQPERVLVQGDTTTTMAASLAAFYAHVPVGHIEAGLRSGSKLSPWPEEANRRIVSVLADLHFAPTSGARANLLRENVPCEQIHVTGNTAIDALLAISRRLEHSNFVSPTVGQVVSEAADRGKRLILITAHRRENWGAGIDQICKAAICLAKRGDVHIVIPVHPNPHVRRPIYRALSGHDGISLLEPLDYLSFVDLMCRSYVILTDSGGVQEEAPSLGKPVLVLRDVGERPEGIAAGSARLVGLDPARIVDETENLLESDTEYKCMSRSRNPYGDGKAAQRIAAILANSAAVVTVANGIGRKGQNLSEGSSWTHV